MKKWFLIGNILFFLVLFFFWKEFFFGELFYVWFLVLFLENFLLFKKKYQWTFLFLLLVVPIILVISYFLGIYYFLFEVFGALFVFFVFFLYMFLLNFKEMSRKVKIKVILGMSLFVLIMFAFIDFGKLYSIDKPIFMILIDDTYYGLGYKGKVQNFTIEKGEIGSSGSGYYEIEFGLWFCTWTFETEYYS